ncbi:MAG: hypothetical protein ACXIUV_03770 [Alkalilacustris sp.]
MDKPPHTQGSARPRIVPPTPPHATPTRAGRPGEVAVETLGLDPFAQLTLVLLRFHFQTFAQPDSQGWLTALRVATVHVGPRAAAPLCYDLVALVQALRHARHSCFNFNRPACGCCSCWLTVEERQLMQVLGAVRSGQKGAALTHALLLCEGNAAEDLVAMAEVYARRHAPDSPQAA